MVDKYQAYSEYKDSGVEWLKSMPSHWENLSLKYCIKKIIDNRGRTPPTGNIGIPLLEAKQMDGNAIFSNSIFEKYISKEAHNKFIRDDVIENDILFVTVGTVGKTNLVPQNSTYTIAQNIVGLRIREDMNPLYFLFYFRSQEIKAAMNATNKNSILDSIKISDFIQTNICIPHINEQSQIAAFLDHETGKIDGLIEKQQLLIKLLKEKRQAVINHAVTKGLNPSSPMKDSGVEWIGDIPEHWKTRPLKFLCSYNDEVLPENMHPDYEIEYVDIGSVSANDGIQKTEKILYCNAPSRAKRVVRDGDVIISTVRTYLEAIAPINTPPKNMVVSTGFAVIRPNKRLKKGYTSYALRSAGFIKEVIIRSVGISYPAINASDLVNIKTIEPPLDEQKEISLFLDNQTTKIDDLISKAQAAITLMQERRTALISAAVTGKIDVRYWQEPEQTINNKEQAA